MLGLALVIARSLVTYDSTIIVCDSLCKRLEAFSKRQLQRHLTAGEGDAIGACFRLSP